MKTSNRIDSLILTLSVLGVLLLTSNLFANSTGKTTGSPNKPDLKKSTPNAKIGESLKSVKSNGQNKAPSDLFLSVGAASVDITPTEKIWLGGYAMRTKTSEGVRKPIFARILDLQKGSTRVVWIVCDLIGFLVPDSDRIRSVIAQQAGIPAESVILSTTHTHSGPAVLPIGTEGADGYMNDFLIPEICKGVRQAAEKKEPCQITVVVGQSSLAHDRRNDPRPGDGAAPNPDKKLACVDTRVPAIGFKRADGTFKAVLIQYAMHPTSYSDYLIGPEWPGATCDAIQKRFGVQTVPFVLQGGAGNLGSPKRRATPEEMKSWGEELVASVADLLTKTAPLPDSPFGFRAKVIPIAQKKMTETEIKEKAQYFRKQLGGTKRYVTGTIDPWETSQLDRLRKGVKPEIQALCAVVTFGRHTFVTTPFETFCHLNQLLAKEVDNPVHIVGYTNGVNTYFPSKEACQQGGYEPEAYLWFGTLPTREGALEQLAKDVAPVVKESVESAAATVTPKFKAARFKVDVTPPVGTHLAYVMNDSIEYPIYVSGLILDDGTTRIVWVSGDFIFISGETYRRWQQNIAQAAGTTPEKVFLHVVHQHDTPLVTTDYKQSEKGDEYVINKEYCLSIEKRIIEAVTSSAAGPWASINRILTAERDIEGLASNRRLVDKNGRCVAMRFSGCTDPKMQAWPVGVIDPKLRTIAFEMNDGKIFTALHFYATHPMAAYQRKKVGPDVPGWALRKLAMKESGPLHIYFNGCGGNLTFGKYNPGGDIKAIETLGNRLADALEMNMQSLKNNTLGKIVLKTTTIEVPFDLDRLKKSAENTERKNNARICLLKTLDRWKHAPITSVAIGDNINFLSIGLSELFVEYQLYAQSLLPGRFLAVASYANGIYEYTPTAKAFQECGYEPSEDACIVTPEIETVLKRGIADVLKR